MQYLTCSVLNNSCQVKSSGSQDMMCLIFHLFGIKRGAVQSAAVAPVTKQTEKRAPPTETYTLTSVHPKYSQRRRGQRCVFLLYFSGPDITLQIAISVVFFSYASILLLKCNFSFFHLLYFYLSHLKILITVNLTDA